MSTPRFNTARERKCYEQGIALVAKKLGKPAPGKRTLDIDDIENEITEKVGRKLGLISGSGTEASMKADNEKLKKLFAENPFFTKGFLSGQRKAFAAKLGKN